MKIIIAGDGKVGNLLTKQLSAEGHDLTLIDTRPEALESTIQRYDVMSVTGNCASMAILRSAGVMDADLLITATGADELNLLCCMTAHGMNPKIHTIARIRAPAYVDSVFEMRKMFALSMVINPERSAAQEMVRLLRYPGFLMRDTFANGIVEIVELRVDDSSILKDQKLMDLSEVTHCKILVAAVVREGKPIIPAGDFILRAGDRIFVTASGSTLSALLKNIGIQTTRIRNVVVAGGGRCAYYLATSLIREGIHVKIIEIDEKRCDHIAEIIPGATIVHGDVSKKEVLEQEHISEADAFITMTGLDELNVILSLYAGTLGVPKVITKLGRGENPELLDKLAVGSMVSPKDLCANSIVTYVRAMDNQVGAAKSVHKIADGQVEAVEFVAEAGTKNLGRPLRDISLKKNILIASIARGREHILPNGDTTIEAGDKVVLVSPADNVILNLNDIFA